MALRTAWCARVLGVFVPSQTRFRWLHRGGEHGCHRWGRARAGLAQRRPRKHTPPCATPTKREHRRTQLRELTPRLAPDTRRIPRLHLSELQAAPCTGISARSVAVSYKPPMLVTRVRLPACACVRLVYQAAGPNQAPDGRRRLDACAACPARVAFAIARCIAQCGLRRRTHGRS